MGMMEEFARRLREARSGANEYLQGGTPLEAVAGGIVGPVGDVWQSNKPTLEKLLRTGGAVGELVAPVGAFLAGYSGDAEAAPKGGKLPGAKAPSRKTVAQLLDEAAAGGGPQPQAFQLPENASLQTLLRDPSVAPPVDPAAAKAARKAEIAAEKKALEKRRAERTAKAAQKADPEGIYPRSAKRVEEAFPDDPDIARSIVKDAKYKAGISSEDLATTRVNRARYREEPATTPGADAPEEVWADWGRRHGVDMTVTPPQSLGISDVASRREVMIPGGLEGRFTIPDMFWLKGNNINPNALPLDVRRQIQQKFNRTHQPDPDVPMSDTQLFNTLQFSQLSPNQPLTQNEFIAQRLRATGPEDLQRLAARAGEPGLDATRGVEEGVQAAARGGMGLRGTPNLATPAVLAKQILEKPEMFRAGEGETIKDVVMRLMNQTPALSQKTAGLGVPMTDLARGNSAAVDLHMIRNALPELLSSPQGPAFLARANELLGTKHTPESLVAQVRAEIADPNVPQSTFEKVRGIIETTQDSVFREKSGELGRIPREYPTALAPEKLLYEPEKASELGPFYRQMLENVDAGRGANPELALFPEQWMRWDGYRGRLEPHEFLHPDFQKLPKQSFNEMQAAYQAHKDAGYTYTPKGSAQPVMKETDWRKLYYGNADPKLLALMAAGGIGGAAALQPTLAQLLREEEK